MPSRSPVREARADTPLPISPWRSLFFRLLEHLEHGSLEVEEAGHRRQFGRPGGEGPRASIEVHDPSFYRAALFEGSVGAGRGFMEGAWTTEDLGSVIRLFARNEPVLHRWGKGWARLLTPLHRLWLWTRRNSRSGARRNIHEHYDLGNDFFRLFLDPGLMYSCAIYPRPESTLEEAADHKVRRICEKLELGPEDHLLEIGTGWGYLALVAARDYGARVTSVTISKEQYDFARARVAEAGVADRVDVQLRDYRDVEGRFDKVVSVEMIEAVGAEHLGTYLQVCAERLREGGRFLLQAILIEDHRYESAVRSVDFIKKYVFPGSFIPSLAVIDEHRDRLGLLRQKGSEELSAHYVRTLSDWHDRFCAAADRVRELGFDESFLRRWRFYLKYCEGGFAEGRLGLRQLLYERS